MWKCYLEREDSKIVGMEWAKQWGFGLGRGMRARLGDDVKWFVESGGQKGRSSRGRIPPPSASNSDSLLLLPLPRPICRPTEKLPQVPGLWVSLHDLRGFL